MPVSLRFFFPRERKITFTCYEFSFYNNLSSCLNEATRVCGGYDKRINAYFELYQQLCYNKEYRACKFHFYLLTMVQFYFLVYNEYFSCWSNIDVRHVPCFTKLLNDLAHHKDSKESDECMFL